MSAVAWYARAAAAYKAHKLQFPDHLDPGSQEALAAVHNSLAPSLLHLCEANGGVYIKAAQLATTISAVPSEFRTCAPHASHPASSSCIELCVIP